MVACTAIGSLSMAAHVAPGHRLTAAIARIPEPQPTSRMRAGCAPASASVCIASRTRRVLACVPVPNAMRSEEHTSELQSLRHLVCRLLLEKKKYLTTVLL